MSASITVYIVDSDASVLRAMARLMRANGINAVCVSRIDALFQQDVISSGSVLLADVRTVRHGGSSLQAQLHEQGLSVPVIYLTDCDTDQMRREARIQGAAGYFRKPVDEQALVDAIVFAVQQIPDPRLTEPPRSS